MKERIDGWFGQQEGSITNVKPDFCVYIFYSKLLFWRKMIFRNCEEFIPPPIKRKSRVFQKFVIKNVNRESVLLHVIKYAHPILIDEVQHVSCDS